MTRSSPPRSAPDGAVIATRQPGARRTPTQHPPKKTSKQAADCKKPLYLLSEISEKIPTACVSGFGYLVCLSSLRSWSANPRTVATLSLGRERVASPSIQELHHEKNRPRPTYHHPRPHLQPRKLLRVPARPRLRPITLRKRHRLRVRRKHAGPKPVSGDGGYPFDQPGQSRD